MDCVAKSSPCVAALADRTHTTLVKVCGALPASQLLYAPQAVFLLSFCVREQTSVLLAREAGGQTAAAPSWPAVSG